MYLVWPQGRECLDTVMSVIKLNILIDSIAKHRERKIRLGYDRCDPDDLIDS